MKRAQARAARTNTWNVAHSDNKQKHRRLQLLPITAGLQAIRATADPQATKDSKSTLEAKWVNLAMK